MKRPRLWQQAAVSIWLCVLFVVVYNGCNYLASRLPHVGSVAFWWERYYPFVPELIIAYWSIDLFFGLAPFFCRSRFLLGQHLKRVSMGILIAGFFFWAFPLTLAFQRPAVPGFLGKLFGSLENFHNFYNCAPSLHITLRTNLWSIYVTPARGALRWMLGGWFALIGISTILCWQHHIIDVITGQLLGLFCLFAFPSVPFQRPLCSLRRSINAHRDIALRYSTGSLILLGLTLAGWPATVLLLWPALALALVAAAYWGAGPQFLRKYQGRQLAGARWLLNPYRWVAEWTYRYFTRNRPAYVEVQPGLRVGRRLTAAEAEEMPAQAVLDLTAEYDEVAPFLERDYRNIPVLDLTAPSLAQIQEAVDFLRTRPDCYIHCSLGLGRSVLMAAAHLIDRGFAYEAALERVRAARPDCRLREPALAVLKEFAETRAAGAPDPG